jgi:hypothetical protein
MRRSDALIVGLALAIAVTNAVAEPPPGVPDRDPGTFGTERRGTVGVDSPAPPTRRPFVGSCASFEDTPATPPAELQPTGGFGRFRPRRPESPAPDPLASCYRGPAFRATRSPITLDRVTVTGGALDPALARRVLRRNLEKLQYCYEKELLAKPEISGTVTLRFTIGGDGHVTGATATGVDPEVASCEQSIIAAMELPKPTDGKPVAVTAALHHAAAIDP